MEILLVFHMLLLVCFIVIAVTTNTVRCLFAYQLLCCLPHGLFHLFLVPRAPATESHTSSAPLPPISSWAVVAMTRCANNKAVTVGVRTRGEGVFKKGGKRSKHGNNTTVGVRGDTVTEKMGARTEPWRPFGYCKHEQLCFFFLTKKKTQRCSTHSLYTNQHRCFNN
uniref:Uncharacterized protein TCIL3000_10_13240 n=1 Tax=Trypanosoma congolense (strain IL3000) TaxID=1068625 RepID=G0UYS4_TRYCI|nr:unnamed protein product [Trypanosoma congolense IL3000]